MNPARSPAVPAFRLSLALLCAGSLAGCFGSPDVDGTSGAAALVEAPDPERAAALADMRQRAAMADRQPFPDAFLAEQTARLAAREEPRSVTDMNAIEVELAAIAQLRLAAVSPEETAALDARAEELLRLAATARGGKP